MRSTSSLAAALACALALLVAPSVARALEPPNQNDPCSSAGKDICGTTGVGFYKEYRYGIRWFGDFRGAVPNAPHTFCLDLGFWYPAARHEYREDTTVGLRNKQGESVSLLNQQKIAYAIWTYGRTTNPSQQAAVMLYVHSLMGDARPGEVDPGALGPSVVAVYSKVAADAVRYHGPYRIVASLPAELTVSKSATATIRVLSAAGNALPGLELALTAPGATGLAQKVKTAASGIARVSFAIAGAADLKLTVATEPLASTLPRIFKATTPAAAPNGQRVAVPASQQISDSFAALVTRSKISASTTAAPATLLVGEASQDKVAISGALASWHETVAVRIYGPFRSAAEIRCDGTPAFQGSFAGKGSGTFTTPAAKLAKPGLYTYQETIPGDTAHVGLTTPCGVAAESFRVELQPQVHTTVSAQRVVPGTPITDTVQVSGLAGEHVTVQAALYGPFASRDAIACTGQPVWTGSLDVPADGEYRTDPFTPTVPGFYTYREQIATVDFVRATLTTCGDEAETTVVPGQPKLATQVSTQRTVPGARITDRVFVSGLGALSVPVTAELWGPFATRGAIRCSGTPLWTGTVLANGDGTYTTAPLRVERAGYYTYRESIAAGPANDAFTAPCAEAAETTFAEAKPLVTTLVSSELVRPGGRIFDRIRLQGLGRTAAGIEVELFGPFASRAAIACDGEPYWRGRITAKGDGVLRSPQVRVAKTGFYTFRERLIASPLIPAVTTACALAPETALAVPEIVTGRGDDLPAMRAKGSGAVTPARVRLASLGIDAPVSPVVIDVPHGVLAAPTDIHRLGWWKDGAAPGARKGAVLIAGHVDSAKGGAGAFFRLHEARPGDRVQVTIAGGRAVTYRVVSVRNYPKAALPTSVWSQKGRARLVLVSCGGPFDQAAGHYRDNVVLTAVPV
jgi:hypothetical protein